MKTITRKEAQALSDRDLHEQYEEARRAADAEPLVPNVTPKSVKRRLTLGEELLRRGTALYGKGVCTAVTARGRSYLRVAPGSPAAAEIGTPTGIRLDGDLDVAEEVAREAFAR